RKSIGILKHQPKAAFSRLSVGFSHEAILFLVKKIAKPNLVGSTFNPAMTSGQIILPVCKCRRAYPPLVNLVVQLQINKTACDHFLQKNVGRTFERINPDRTGYATANQSVRFHTGSSGAACAVC